MKFKCDKPKKANRRAEWHRKFAWWPVQVAPGDCRWLEVVQRKGRVERGYECYRWVYEYRALDDINPELSCVYEARFSIKFGDILVVPNDVMSIKYPDRVLYKRGNMFHVESVKDGHISGQYIEFKDFNGEFVTYEVNDLIRDWKVVLK